MIQNHLQKSTLHLFKGRHIVFFMEAVVRICSSLSYTLRKGKAVLFFANNCQEPDKTAQAREQFSVKEGEERNGERWRACQRESKSMQRKMFLPDREWGKYMKNQSKERKRGRMKLRSIDTHLQQHVFLSLLWDLVWNSNRDSAAEMAKLETITMRGEGLRKRGG